MDSEEESKPTVMATNHAYERAKQRFGWKSSVLEKMMEKAFIEGIQHKDTTGTLNRYITKLWMDYKTCNNIRIYGEDIYFFKNNLLITLYRIESKLIKHVKNFSKK